VNNKIKPVKNKKNQIDIHATVSQKKGMGGIFETFVRTFKNIGFVVVFAPIAFVGLICMGLAMGPAMAIYHILTDWITMQNWPILGHYTALGLTLALSYFSYGISLIFIAPLFNKLMPFKLRAWKGNWYSLQTIPWFYHNALTYIVRFTFLDLVTPSPLNILFYRMMGMKIGKGVMINTTYISDPCLITLEDYVTIGGSATLFAHYGQKGILILAPVVIKTGATIGLKASIMGDVVIGAKVVVPPHAVILPKSRIPDGARFKSHENQYVVPDRKNFESESTENHESNNKKVS